MPRLIPACLIFALAGLCALAEIAPDHHWPLDHPAALGLTLFGGAAAGAQGIAEGNCIQLSGTTVLQATDSSDLTESDNGFTFTIWVNPYSTDLEQQMIAAKNVYSRDQRQWGVMIDDDGLFRLYAWQGKWRTAEAVTKPQPGSWHLVGVIVTSAKAELWVNGERAGAIKLDRPLPDTDAPLTFGGVNDNGRIWQNLFGALDEARLYDHALTGKEMAAIYKPETAIHPIPDSPKPRTLWDPTSKIPDTKDLPMLKDVRFAVIKPHEFQKDGYRFLHGVALRFHKNRLYASFGHNQGGENTDSEEARICHSDDNGKTWSDVTMIDPGAENGVGVSHGVFHSHEGKLWAFQGAYKETMENVHTRAYQLDETTGQWQAVGIIIKNGFWPMQEPVKLESGNWIMSGLRVGNGNPAAVAISHGDDITRWTLVVIPRPPGAGNMWGESTVIVNGSQVLNIARYGSKAKALLAVSKDHGRTWTASLPSNLPMATSKPYSGCLSTGQHYLVCTTTADSGGRRSPLTIALTRPGETVFSKVFVIRHALFPDGPGESHPRAKLSYPYAIEHEGHLYVGYSNDGGNVGRVGQGRQLWNNNSAELAVIPVKDLSWESD